MHGWIRLNCMPSPILHSNSRLLLPLTQLLSFDGTGAWGQCVILLIYLVQRIKLCSLPASLFLSSQFVILGVIGFLPGLYLWFPCGSVSIPRFFWAFSQNNNDSSCLLFILIWMVNRLLINVISPNLTIEFFKYQELFYSQYFF